MVNRQDVPYSPSRQKSGEARFLLKKFLTEQS
jgi:hypothetical protein